MKGNFYCRRDNDLIDKDTIIALRYTRDPDHTRQTCVSVDFKQPKLQTTRCAIKLTPHYFFIRKLPLGSLPADETLILEKIEDIHDWKIAISTITVNHSKEDFQLNLKTPELVFNLNFVTVEEFQDWGYCVNHNAHGYDVKTAVFHKYYSVPFLSEQSLSARDVGICVDRVTKESFGYRTRKASESVTQALLAGYRQSSHHPNLVRPIDAFEDNSVRVTLVFESFSDMLFTAISKSKNLTEQEISRVSRQILAALVFLHERGMVHGDLRPSCIVCSEKNNPFTRVKLFDFRHAAVEGSEIDTSKNNPTDQEKGSGSSLGSVFHGIRESLSSPAGKDVKRRIYFSPPEYFLSEKIIASPASDIWSCGVLIYWMLCGALPFKGNSIEELLGKMKEGPQFKEPDWAHLSEEAPKFIKKMLAYNPEDRPEAFDLLDNRWVLDHDILSHSVLQYDVTSMYEAENHVVEQEKKWGDMNALITKLKLKK